MVTVISVIVSISALSNILENTAFMGDILLRMPDISQPILHSTDWPVLYAWSLAFANQTQLLDSSTSKLIQLVRIVHMYVCLVHMQ